MSDLWARASALGLVPGVSGPAAVLCPQASSQSALPEALLLKVFVLSDSKFSISPLTHLPSPASCKCVPYSFFRLFSDW